MVMVWGDLPIGSVAIHVSTCTTAALVPKCVTGKIRGIPGSFLDLSCLSGNANVGRE